MIRNPQLDTYNADKIVDFAKRVRDLHSADELTTAVSTRMCLAVSELVVDGMSLIEALKHTCYRSTLFKQVMTQNVLELYKSFNQWGTESA